MRCLQCTRGHCEKHFAQWHRDGADHTCTCTEDHEAIKRTVRENRYSDVQMRKHVFYATLYTGQSHKY